MARSLSLPLLVLALLVAACGDDGDPVRAGDGDPDPGPAPITELTVAYTHTGADVAATYRITCLGDTATVDGDEVDVDGRAACDNLTEPAVQQRLTLGAPTDLVCTEVYGGEDTATITGRVDDVAVDTTVDRTNGCGIGEWDDLLAAILPTPIGVQP